MITLRRIPGGCRLPLNLAKVLPPVAVIMGAFQCNLLNVVGLLGATLFVAGVVNGAGRYRGAGVSLLVVFWSAKVISEAPKGFQRASDMGF